MSIFLWMLGVTMMISLCGVYPVSIAGSTAEAFNYDDHGKRDPFWPLVNANGNIISYESELLVTDLTLEGIISEPTGQNLAVINSHIVKTKDTLGLFVVGEITRNSVILIKGKDKFELKLKKEE